MIPNNIKYAIQMPCKICAENMSVYDTALLLNKYTATYYRCPQCGFIQTEDPYWLSEAYSKAIATADTGIMLRNLSNANTLLFLLKYIPNGIYMDFGGGHGILTRIMRDYGFDFYHYDKYAENLFAQGFEADLDKKYTLITAFENFEHFVNPLMEIEKLLGMTDTLFFSTLLIPPPAHKRLGWYYSPSTGQHISFYTLETLEFIAEKYNMQLLSNNNDTHILSRFPLRNDFFKLLQVYNKKRVTIQPENETFKVIKHPL